MSVKTKEEIEQELEEAARLAREALDKANEALERLRNAGHEPPADPTPALADERAG